MLPLPFFPHDAIKDEHVLLLHGLGESQWYMMLLEAALATAGYTVTNAGYPSTAHPAEELTEKYIAPLFDQHADKRILHVVTHSLGGILVRHYLQDQQPANLGRVVMLAPAQKGSPMFDLYVQWQPFLSLNGPVALQTTTGDMCFSRKLREEVDYPLGIIAGSIPSDPLAMLLMAVPNDGRTTVEDTQLKGMRDHIVLPTSHEGITFDPASIFQTLHFLKHEKFMHVHYSQRGRIFA
jgi:triacylglycerol lipase